MNKNLFSLLILVIGLILVIFSTNFVAAYLCKGTGGYYYDCGIPTDYNKYSDTDNLRNSKSIYLNWDNKDYSNSDYYKESSDYEKIAEYEKRDKEGYEKEKISIKEKRDVEIDYKKYEDRGDDYGYEDYNWIDWDFLWDTSNRKKDQYVLKLGSGNSKKDYKDYSQKPDYSVPIYNSNWRYKEPYKTQDYKDCVCEKWNCVEKRCSSWNTGYSSYYGRRCYDYECIDWECEEWECEDKYYDNYYYKPRYEFATQTYNWRW